MKTLGVCPEFPETYWSFRHTLSFEGKSSAFPPLGLLTVSSTSIHSAIYPLLSRDHATDYRQAVGCSDRAAARAD
jgi:hypothetical protein